MQDFFSFDKSDDSWTPPVGKRPQLQYKYKPLDVGSFNRTQPQQNFMSQPPSYPTPQMPQMPAPQQGPIPEQSDLGKFLGGGKKLYDLYKKYTDIGEDLPVFTGTLMDAIKQGLPQFGSIITNPASPSADLGFIGDEIADLYPNAGPEGLVPPQGTTDWLGGGLDLMKGLGSALGLGLSGYDMLKNGVDFENFGGALTSGLGLASSLGLAGAGPAAAVLAIPFGFKKLFGGSSREPNFMDYDQMDAPFYEDEAGNLYLVPERQMRLNDRFIRYNPTTNQFERPVMEQMPSYALLGNERDYYGPSYNPIFATGEWTPMKLYQGDAQHPGYYFHPGGTVDDLYSLASLQKVIQNDVVNNPALVDRYNQFTSFYGMTPGEAEARAMQLQQERQSAELRQREIEMCGSPGCSEGWDVGI